MVLLPNGGGEPEKFNLTFSVTDGENAVEGATVTINSISGTTGSAGGCTLQNVPSGNQTVTATKNGFEEYSDSITVDRNKTVNIVLTAE